MVIDLTRDLVRFNTANPPGDERACADMLGARLEAAGFSVRAFEFADRRRSLVARIGGQRDRMPICFTGHLDVVPIGAAPWKKDPFAGEIDGNRIHGRGTTDMKGGVAAIVTAAIASAGRLESSPGLTLVLTAGEETGSEGAFDLVHRGALGHAGAIVVGEPTENAPFVGHKGCIRFRCITRGVTAHSSMPELGDNAIYKAVRAIGALEQFAFDGPDHPVMGRPTMVVSQMQGGMNVNSVPDRAEFAVDVRTIPGQDLAALRQKIRETIDHSAGASAEIQPLVEVPSVFTPIDDDWVQQVFELAREVTGAEPALRTGPYFTDASALTPAYGAPTVILGPGQQAMAHQTDEYCPIPQLGAAVELYTRIIDRWCTAAR